MAPTKNGNKQARKANRANRQKEMAGRQNIATVRSRENARTNSQLVAAVNELKKLSFKPQLPAHMRPKKGKGKGNRSLGVGPALTKFVSAIRNPFSASALGCYLPTLPGRNTYKTYGESRFEATIGTQNMGFVLISPTTANDAVAGYYTDSTFAGTKILPWASAASTAGVLATGVNGITMPLPFDTAALSHSVLSEVGTPQSVYGRVVAVGIRAFYIGPTSDEGGMVYCFVDPEHGDLSGYSLADLGKRRECEISLNGRDQCTMVGVPISVAETEFYNNTAVMAAQATQTTATHYSGVAASVFPWSNGMVPDAVAGGSSTPVRTVGGAYVGVSPMLVAFTGIAGRQVHVEMIYHVEYEGKLTEGSATPSMVDNPGTLRTLAAVNKAYAIKSADKSMFSTAFAKALPMCK